MAAAPGNERLRVSTRSAVAAVALLGITLGFLAVAAAATRVLVWVALAATLAGLLEPAVARLARVIPRGLAVGAVALGTVAVVAGATYGLVGDVVAQTRVLQRAAPARAAALEESGRFSPTARALNLADRTDRFVKEVPVRLRGGAPAQAVQAATRRGLALLAISVLAVFFLLHGPGLAAGAARQVRDPERRERLSRVADAAWHRGFAYARGMLAMAVLTGLLAYVAALATGVPGPAPLALWVALWDLVPLVGATAGALPMVALAAVRSPTQGLALAAVFTGWQVVENLVLQRRLEQATVRIGPFLTAAAGAAGLELYGLPGALLAVLVVAMAVAVAHEVAETAERDDLAGGSAVAPEGRQVGMEVSDKHGPRLDEALKEDHSTRAQEFRRDEGPDDDLPVSPDRDFRPDLPQEREGVLDDRDAGARADLARHIDPSVFPAHPDALVESAQGHFAPDWIIRALRGLPDQVYDNVQDVWRAMGGAVEERRA